MRGAYSNQRAKRPARISILPAESRERNCGGTGEEGGRKGW